MRTRTISVSVLLALGLLGPVALLVEAACEPVASCPMATVARGAHCDTDGRLIDRECCLFSGDVQPATTASRAEASVGKQAVQAVGSTVTGSAARQDSFQGSRIPRFTFHSPPLYTAHSALLI